MNNSQIPNYRSQKKASVKRERYQERVRLNITYTLVLKCGHTLYGLQMPKLDGSHAWCPVDGETSVVSCTKVEGTQNE